MCVLLCAALVGVGMGWVCLRVCGGMCVPVRVVCASRSGDRAPPHGVRSRRHGRWALRAGGARDAPHGRQDVRAAACCAGQTGMCVPVRVRYSFVRLLLARVSRRAVTAYPYGVSGAIYSQPSLTAEYTIL